MLNSSIDPVFQVREVSGKTTIGYLPWSLLRRGRLFCLIVTPFVISIIVNLWAAYQPQTIRTTVTLGMLVFMVVFGFVIPFWIIRQLQTIELERSSIRVGSSFHPSEKKREYEVSSITSITVIRDSQGKWSSVVLSFKCGTQEVVFSGLGSVPAESLASFLRTLKTDEPPIS